VEQLGLVRLERRGHLAPLGRDAVGVERPYGRRGGLLGGGAVTSGRGLGAGSCPVSRNRRLSSISCSRCAAAAAVASSSLCRRRLLSVARCSSVSRRCSLASLRCALLRRQEAEELDHRSRRVSAQDDGLGLLLVRRDTHWASFAASTAARNSSSVTRKWIASRWPVSPVSENSVARASITAASLMCESSSSARHSVCSKRSSARCHWTRRSR